MVSITNTGLHPLAVRPSVVITERVYPRKCFLSLGSKPFWGSFLGFQVHAFPSQPLKFLASSGIIVSREKAGLTRCPGSTVSAQHRGSSQGPRRESLESGHQSSPGISMSWASSGFMGYPPGKEGCGGQERMPILCWCLERGGLPQEHMDASEPLMFLGAANQSNPEPLDFGRFSGWLR